MPVRVTLHFKALLILAETWRQARANHPAAPHLPLSVATHQVPLSVTAQAAPECARGDGAPSTPEPLWDFGRPTPSRPLQDGRPAPAPSSPSSAVAAWTSRLGSTSASTSKWVTSRRAMARKQRRGGHSGQAHTSQPAAASLPPRLPLLLSVQGSGRPSPEDPEHRPLQACTREHFS